MNQVPNLTKIYINNCLIGASSFATKPRLNMSSYPNPVASKMHSKLMDSFIPDHLEIINESYMHNVPKGSETHFKVVVVSKKFDGVPLIERHRKINDILADELKCGVHALSIIAKTPDKWQQSDKIIDPSPNCKGGFGK